MFLDHWSPAFRKLMQGGIPTRYISLDTETSGLSTEKDIVGQIGFTIVDEAQLVRKQSITIDWTKEDFVSFVWLRDRLKRVKEDMEAQGRSCTVSIERMQKEGMVPSKAFKGLLAMLRKANADGYFIIGHNLFFDEDILGSNFRRFGFSDSFSYGERVLDTMVLERINVSTSKYQSQVAPKPSESVRDYFSRLRWLGGRSIKTNLDRHCANKYALVDKTELEKAHDAEFDSYLVHLLVEYWRKQYDERPIQQKTRTVRPQRNF